MLTKFQNHILHEKLFTKNDRLLVAISGGIDSVVLLHLLVNSGFKPSLAHVNFQLRAEESTRDQDFVKALANEYKLPLFTEKFDTKNYALERKLSIQEAAREIRYQWFDALIEKYKFKKLLTAHHADDSIETFFINLLRGSGIQGLSGIPQTNKNIIRPLLPFFRNEIEEYGLQNKISYVTDSSNSNTHYLRNAIRLQLLPILNELKPNANQSISKSILYLSEVNKFYKNHVEALCKKLLINIVPSKQWQIPISKLKSQSSASILLFEMLSPFGFNTTQINQILLCNTVGSLFLSPTHQLLVDRTHYFISLLNKNQELLQYEIKEEDEQLQFGRLLMNITKVNEVKSINKSVNVAQLNTKNLSYPLILRKWQKGDYFYPFGLNKKKKISDYLTNKKVPKTEKENTWVLTSGQHICWVVGHTIDHRFAINHNKNAALVLTINQSTI